jgi:hypothetical protein
VLIGAAGFAGGLAATSIGMRHVIHSTGGFCASGGPYEIRNPCPKGDTELVIFGILGLIAGGLVLAGFVARCEGSTVGVACAMWAALFGVLGFNFLDLGNSIVTGVLFELMALGGLVAAGSLLVGWLRHPEDHGKPVFDYSSVITATRQPPAS